MLVWSSFEFHFVKRLKLVGSNLVEPLREICGRRCGSPPHFETAFISLPYFPSFSLIFIAAQSLFSFKFLNLSFLGCDADQ
jgi:hypothetical protein